ncbi:MAG: hypothetical protein NW223_10445 [Hyphomicrobiaceae bacterium]|nr:hypothetical protein [Hyphomicrobiaceae bacterium]
MSAPNPSTVRAMPAAGRLQSRFETIQHAAKCSGGDADVRAAQRLARLARATALLGVLALVVVMLIHAVRDEAAPPTIADQPASLSAKR